MGKLKHGQDQRYRRSPEYVVWFNMIQRCHNPNHTYYKNYGGRGIIVCVEWRESFAQFNLDMGSRPEGKMLGRVNNNSPYCKENCRWETRMEQNSNTRRNRFLTAHGETKTLAEWSRCTGIDALLIAQRIKQGWSVERAVTEPAKTGWTINEFNRTRGISET